MLSRIKIAHCLVEVPNIQINSGLANSLVDCPAATQAARVRFPAETRRLEENSGKVSIVVSPT